MGVLWQYAADKTAATDNKAAVTGANYFNNAANQLEVGILSFAERMNRATQRPICQSVCLLWIASPVLAL